MNNRKYTAFNNSIEIGLRILVLLRAGFPNSYDLQTLIYLDYLTIHSGDIEGGPESIHPDAPHRKGELYVRRELIQNGIEIYKKKGLIIELFTKDGIEFSASENAAPFLETLNSNYFKSLSSRGNWTIKHFEGTDKTKFNIVFEEFLESDLNHIKINLFNE